MGVRVRIQASCRTFAELLIDCEEDGTLRALLMGMPRATEPQAPGDG
jgi:hypothetical protein